MPTNNENLKTSNFLITLKNVEYTYEGSQNPVLKNLNVHFCRGEITAILGSSGSGKSTLLNIIGLLTIQTQGSLKMFDTEITSDLDSNFFSHLRNKELGFVFQSFHLLPKLTVFENILLPSLYNTELTQIEVEKTAKNLMKKLGIADFEKRFPNELSGGQKQRVAICRALLLSPSLILADEPTGALDSKTSKEVLEIFKQLAAEGQTVLIITHDKLVAAQCHRIIRLKDGKIDSDESGSTIRSSTNTCKEADSDTERSEKKVLTFNKQNRLDKWNKFYFKFTSLVRLTFRNLAAQKLRSFLTVLGLTVGVSSIVIMHSLISETQNVFSSFFNSNGANSAFLQSDRREAEKLGLPRWRGMLLGRETEDFFSRFEGKIKVRPVIEVDNCILKSEFQSISANLQGIFDLQEFSQDSLKTEIGRVFSPSEVGFNDLGLRPILLGADLKKKLFPDGKLFTTGDKISVSGCEFSGTLQVVGILGEQDSTFNPEANSNGVVPAATLIGGGASRYVTSFSLTPEIKSISPTKAGEIVKNALILKTKNKFPFRFFAPEQQIQKINMMLGLFSILTTLIGILCTIIGGVGVMNIMLVGITERMREIGLRRALGAKESDIRNQFIIETVILCVFAGFSGVLVGIFVSNFVLNTAANLFPKFLEPKFIFNFTSIALAFGGALGTGVLFGLYPAFKAAKKDVISSLRME